MKFDNEFCGIGNAAECDKTGCIYKTGETAKITVTVKLNMPPVSEGFIGEGATVNLNRNIKPIWGENDWDDWNCKIDGDSRDTLICEVERTESGSDEITFKPEFPENFVVAGVEQTVYGGSRELSDIWISEKIKKCGGKKVEWVDVQSIMDSECKHHDSDGNGINDFVCCNVGGIGDLICAGERTYWCSGQDTNDFKINGFTFTDCEPRAGGIGNLGGKLYQALVPGGDPSRAKTWCCAKKPVGVVVTPPVKPEQVIETPEIKLQKITCDNNEFCENKAKEFGLESGYCDEGVCKTGKKPIVCGDNKCDDGETCENCVGDCGCKGDLVCDNGKCVKAGEKGNPCRKVGNECDEELVCENEACETERVGVGVVGGDEIIKSKVNVKSGGSTSRTVNLGSFELENTGNVPITNVEVSFSGKCIYNDFCLWPSGCGIEIDKSCEILTKINPGESKQISTNDCNFKINKDCDAHYSCTATLNIKDKKITLNSEDLSC